jgi:hypothetical protein
MALDADSDLKADFNSDKIVCPPCHAIEMGREKVIVAIEKGSTGDIVSEKVAESVECGHGVTDFGCQGKSVVMEGSTVKNKVSNPLDKGGTEKFEPIVFGNQKLVHDEKDFEICDPQENSEVTPKQFSREEGEAVAIVGLCKGKFSPRVTPIPQRFEISPPALKIPNEGSRKFAFAEPLERYPSASRGMAKEPMESFFVLILLCLLTNFFPQPNQQPVSYVCWTGGGGNNHWPNPDSAGGFKQRIKHFVQDQASGLGDSAAYNTRASKLPTTQESELLTTVAMQLLITRASKLPTTQERELFTTAAMQMLITRASKLPTSRERELFTTAAMQLPITRASKLPTTQERELFTTAAMQLLITRALKLPTVQRGELHTIRAM